MVDPVFTPSILLLHGRDVMSRNFGCGRICVCLAVFAVAVGGARLVNADLINNGGFDADLSGWLQTEPAGWSWFDAAATGSPDGAGAICNNTDCWLYQPGCTPPGGFVAGRTYELSFLACQGGAVGAIMQATITTGSGTYGESVTLTDSYQKYSVVFTATADDVGQSFQPAFLGAAGTIMGLDSVRLDAVPEPSAIVMAFAAMIGLAAYAWRKQR